MSARAYPSREPVAAPSRRRLEPVVWSAWRPGAPLRIDEKRGFEEHGHLVFPRRFSASEVEVLRAEAERIRTCADELDPASVVREPRGSAIRSVFGVHRLGTVLPALRADVRLLDLARWILDDDVYVHQSRLNFKPGFDGEAFDWHSDFETWHCEDGMPAMRALSVCVLLDDNTACNGPLLVIPGSHRYFFPCVGETPDDHYRESLRRQRYGVPAPDLLTELAGSLGIEAILGEAGTVVVFDCNLLHASAGNVTPLPRSNLFLVYNALSNRLGAPQAGLRPRPEFLASRSFEPVER